MNEVPFDLIYRKAKKIRTNLLLYTEKYIKQNQKKENNNKLNNLINQTQFQEVSMEVSFEEFYDEKNVQIFTQKFENKEKKVISHLSSISFYHISEKSLCTFKYLSNLSTVESITKKNIENDKKKNDYFFFNKKSKTKTEKLEKMFLFKKNNNFPIDYENINKLDHKNIKTFNGNLIYDYKKNITIGKKYLRNLSKYLGVLLYKKKKCDKKTLIKRYIKKYISRKEVLFN